MKDNRTGFLMVLIALIIILFFVLASQNGHDAETRQNLQECGIGAPTRC